MTRDEMTRQDMTGDEMTGHDWRGHDTPTPPSLRRAWRASFGEVYLGRVAKTLALWPSSGMLVGSIPGGVIWVLPASGPEILGEPEAPLSPQPQPQLRSTPPAPGNFQIQKTFPALPPDLPNTSPS